jgi:hypothetical protein
MTVKDKKVELSVLECDSVAIKRLIEEVRLAKEEIRAVTSYNRIYNRHNR